MKNFWPIFLMFIIGCAAGITVPTVISQISPQTFLYSVNSCATNAVWSNSSCANLCLNFNNNCDSDCNNSVYYMKEFKADTNSEYNGEIWVNAQ